MKNNLDKKIARLKKAGHSSTKIEAILFEDAPYAAAYQRGTSQRAWNSLACATRRRVKKSRI